jgi:hypothetical protein
VSEKLFGSAICAMGGSRGGQVIPGWFDRMASLGIRHAWLFWAVPAGRDSEEELDRLRATVPRWLADLRAGGVSGELVIKRGRPGFWLSSLAGICDAGLIVTGPPSMRGGSSETIDHLLEHSRVPLLLLPEGGPATDATLLRRPIVELGGSACARGFVDAWTGAALRHEFDSAELAPRDAAREILRLALDVEATAIVLSGGLDGLAQRLLHYGTVPLLVAPRVPVAAALRGGVAIA